VAESRERSAAEREAARLERERRRGKSAGLPAGEASDGAQPVQVDPPVAAVPPTRRVVPPPPVAPTPRVVPPPPVAPKPRVVPPSVVSGPQELPSTEQFTNAPEGEEAGGWDDEHEVAAGTRRVGWRERTAGAAVTTVPQSERAPAGPSRPAHSRFPGGRSRVVRLAALVALLLAAVLIWFCVELFQPFHGQGHGSLTVTIPARSSSRPVGDLLARDGVVSSGFFFYLRAKLAGDGGQLLAGTYHLKLDMSYGQALKALTTAPPAAKVSNVTIVPGKTRVQINALLRAQGFRGSYLAATRRSPLLNLAAYGAPKSTPSLEGFLYPDTYQLRDPITASALAAAQLTQFRKRFATVSLAYARSKRLTAYDVLTIASIIEKEAATTHDEPLVASVIYNRLKDGIALGMDSTTRYEFNDYTKPLTSSQLAAQSPYNTRVNKGLPPTPIGNPGLSAIQAAAHPAQSNYLYFVAKPCGNGASVFSSSYNQFLVDSARYQSARAQHGGRSPTKC
jgi:uncharacterized YceG family protein